MFVIITGVFLRHYKVYQGVYFIPICNDYKNQYSIFVGNNAVGKSSIMEGLNTFFNGGVWNKNKSGKRDEAFIAPLFLFEKEKLNKLVNNQKAKDFIGFLSDYFWDASEDINPNLKSNEFKTFFQYRDELKYRYKKQDYYLFLLGITYDDKNSASFITFTQDLIKKIPPELKDYNYDELIDTVKDLYSYIYIPVETTTSTILKIENREMQELMSTDILEKIDSILNKKNFEQGRKAISVIDFLNHSLNEYMDSINDIIGEIDNSYAYNVETGFKKNLTSTDVRKKILEAYFSIRTLKKEKKEIYELSSGEQRIALIDMATAFLIGNKDGKKKKVILAIDEPENSLHITKSFSQFERLQKLSNQNQLLLTTHWYGSMPVTDTGNVQYIERQKEKRIKINSYDLNNYFEKRGSLPEDILIKSYFELTSSILSSMRASGTNWIICEGSDDKLYLEYYLKGIKNLKIFAVGGCGNVVKLYQYLFTPFAEKDENKALNSKVLCLIDTDDVLKTISIPSEVKDKLRIARMQYDREQNIALQRLNPNGLFTPTEMEDCLNPEILFTTLVKSINQYGNSNQRDAMGNFSFNKEIKSSFIKGEENSIIKPTNIEGYQQKGLIYDFIDDYRNKYLIAQNYVEEAQKREVDKFETPRLFKLIEEFFK